MSTANLSFQEKLEGMADKLLGSMDASEYKHIVLVLLFLKYVSDSFEELHAELKEILNNYIQNNEQKNLVNISKSSTFSKSIIEELKKKLTIIKYVNY